MKCQILFSGKNQKKIFKKKSKCCLPSMHNLFLIHWTSGYYKEYTLSLMFFFLFCRLKETVIRLLTFFIKSCNTYISDREPVLVEIKFHFLFLIRSC